MDQEKTVQTNTELGQSNTEELIQDAVISEVKDKENQPKGPNPMAGLLRQLGAYKWYTAALLILTLISSGVTLVIPSLISKSIDGYKAGTYDLNTTLLEFSAAIFVILLLGLGQSFFQTYIAELVSRDIRKNLSEKISRLSYAFIQEYSGGKLLTNLTSDIDSIRNFLSWGVVQLVTSILLIIGTAVLLISTNWKLGLAVLTIVPVLLVTFFLIFKNIVKLFEKAQAITDTLNRIINESILGSSLIRVLNSSYYEMLKFNVSNKEAKDIGTQILKVFATVFPVIAMIANLGIIIVLVFGGNLVINNELTLGQFAAFIQYISIFIFPVIVLGFISSEIGNAVTAYGRIEGVLNADDDNAGGEVDKEIKGKIEFRNVSLKFGETQILKNLSFVIEPGSRAAVLGPTAAGKTQIFYLITGLQQPTEGEILIDDVPVNEYKKDTLYRQLGLVFQDSILFNTTIEENISFRKDVQADAINKAIDTAELQDFIDQQTDGLNTVLSERGSSLSGGQKQRLTLARALALDPSILLLDDFTARVDNQTEKRIFEKVIKNYSGITQLIITQKIASIADFDQIILLMEGEILAKGTHEELLNTSFEYQQIYESQQTTEE